ncbi:MAG: M14 family metallopeptidase [Bacteroides sp.]|nr:M14 family metallopeptidase [Bacteroides sp.]
MTKETVYKFESAYRGDFNVRAYHFNKGEKSCCIVGALRGNEIQQLYVCSKLIKALSELERQCRISYGHRITVIPCVNPFSMNIGKRFWSSDNRDINRDFPGIADGEPTRRIAARVLEAVSGYQYGIQFASFYIQGDFIPHVRMMETGKENTGLANLFGLPYVVKRDPRPFDKNTLNYNWQLNGTSAFSVYTNETENIDEASADLAVASVLRFLSRMGMIKHQCHGGYMATILEEEALMPVKSASGGIYRRIKHPGDEVERGEIMAEVLDPYENNVTEKIKAPCNGIVFFAHKSPLVCENTVLYKIIKRLKN